MLFLYKKQGCVGFFYQRNFVCEEAPQVLQYEQIYQLGDCPLSGKFSPVRGLSRVSQQNAYPKW